MIHFVVDRPRVIDRTCVRCGTTPPLPVPAEAGQHGHERVPPGDLAAGTTGEAGVDGATGPGSGDVGGGRTAVLHRAHGSRGHGGEGVAPPARTAVEFPAGGSGVRMAPTL